MTGVCGSSRKVQDRIDVRAILPCLLVLSMFRSPCLGALCFVVAQLRRFAPTAAVLPREEAKEKRLTTSVVSRLLRSSAGGGNRTHTLLPELDFESSASANSATPA